MHLATHRLSGTKCAVKKIPKSATAHLTRELHHHRRLHHPHIVHLYEIVATEQYVWLVSELCSGGELFDYLVERGRLLEGEARRLFGELCVAVGWLHKQGVVHRDLKLENVLLDGDMRIKLGDLGFAREWQKGRLYVVPDAWLITEWRRFAERRGMPVRRCWRVKSTWVWRRICGHWV